MDEIVDNLVSRELLETTEDGKFRPVES